jgi:hypothetical protein
MEQEQDKEKYWTAYYKYLDDCDDIVNNASYSKTWEEFNLYSLKIN